MGHVEVIVIVCKLWQLTEYGGISVWTIYPNFESLSLTIYPLDVRLLFLIYGHTLNILQLA